VGCVVRINAPAILSSRKLIKESVSLAPNSPKFSALHTGGPTLGYTTALKSGASNVLYANWNASS
jgi:hypothetical protein